MSECCVVYGVWLVCEPWAVLLIGAVHAARILVARVMPKCHPSVLLGVDI